MVYFSLTKQILMSKPWDEIHLPVCVSASRQEAPTMLPSLYELTETK